MLEGRGKDDVLHVLCELLRHSDARGLKALSQTSRQVRAVCMPVLFSRCFSTVYVPLPDPQIFLPYSLWPHVQYLVINDDCWEKVASTPIRDIKNSLLCRVVEGPLFEHWLSKLPQLQSLFLYQIGFIGEESHGISWPALCQVLSLPAIRKVIIRRLHICPALRSTDKLYIGSISPVTIFLYSLDAPPETFLTEPEVDVEPDYNSEMAALGVALGALHASLERLELPICSAPLHIFPLHAWPRLRRLVLRGKPSESFVSSLLSSVASIPDLRSLVLKFSSRDDIQPVVLWRADLISAFPWTALEELVVTNPNPVDQLFDHLPPTLLNLSLCYWRHLYHEFLIPYRPMDPSEGPRFALLLGSMEMCRLLRRSQTLMLTRLTLEYRAADGDDELLDHIAHTYPCLAYLKFIRYRPHGATYVDVEHIAHAFRPLNHLDELKLHLDLPDMPLPSPYIIRSDDKGTYSPEAMERFRVTVDETAGVFARELGSSVRYLSILTPTASRTASRSYWELFRVTNGQAVPHREG